MPEFIEGIKSASDYLNNTNVGIPTSVSADPLAGTINVTQTQFQLKELVCALLAGNGIKLPNIQMCLKINLEGLLGAIPDAMNALKAAFLRAMAALDDFIAHTGIDALLERVNGFISEVAAIANMLNFCGTPVIPRAIPNVLSDMTGAFTGKGLDLLNGLGAMVPSAIGGCANIGLPGVGLGGISGGFNVNFDAFITGPNGGVIGNIKQYLSDIGGDLTDLINTPASVWEGWVTQLDGFTNDIQDLITFENNYKDLVIEGGSAGRGGSTFSPVNDPTRINTGVGVTMDTSAQSFSEAQRRAQSIRSSYNALKAYAVDEEGNNLFHYILEPELIAKLEDDTEHPVTTQEQVPLYDYCGRCVGYTTQLVNPDAPGSTGGPAQPSSDPGSNFTEEEATSPIVEELQAEIADLKARLDALGG